MVICKSGYDPQEDSILLEKWVRQYAKGKVLDIGTGSGIQAIAAALNPGVKSVLAADIQKRVIDYCRKNIKNRKIKFTQSD
ncbi:MAG: 50S ribosomal protein L11 methyltransferase, partial [Nanoarchaeota archaeon]